ncbi:pilus assembly protein [Klebsiella aerogenes]|nr:pilus assembly protein [Klebsiella aerogenes]
MNTLFRLCCLLLALFIAPAWAVECYQNNAGGLTSVTATLPAFTIPNDAQIGKKIWESPDINITVYCQNASGWRIIETTEEVYAWVKLPELNGSDVLNNPYFTFGVTYNGADHEGIREGIPTHTCMDRYSDSSKAYHAPDCNGTTLQKNITFPARFRLYAKLKAFPPDDKTIYDFGPINVLQFDGQGQVDTSSTHNLRYYIDGLDNIHFLDCSVDIRIDPESQNVDFGQVISTLVATSPPRQPFSVSTVKDQAAGCTEQFDVTTSFYTDDTLYDATHLDMGNGLLMRILDTTTHRDVEYNQYAAFATYVPGESTTVVTHDYIAELTKNPTKDIEDGPFSKSLIIKINYQ